MSGRIGDYELLRSLGKGGMGEVWLARHDFLDKLFAVKIPSPAVLAQPDYERHFMEEGRLLNRLDHPHIVKVHNIGKDGDRFFLVMDFASPDGERSESLDEVLRARADRKLPWRETTRMVAQVCRAMAYAHGKGVIHRDLKPSNVLMDRGGAVKVSDFGLATMAGDDFMLHSMVLSMGGSLGLEKTRGPAASSGASAAEASLGAEATRMAGTPGGNEGIVGTFHYMPPEVQRREGWTVQGDIYSLGVLAYRMLVGEHPVGRYRLPHEVDAEIPGLWDAVIERAMAGRPADRYGSMEEMLEALCDIDPELSMAEAGTPMAVAGGGEIPETAVRMVREYVGRHNGKHERGEAWVDFVMAFYRTPGHDPVDKGQLEALVQEECRRWAEREARRLDLEARQAEERRKAAEDAEKRRKEAEEARRRVERERRARQLAGEAAAATASEDHGKARRLWEQVVELTPDDSAAKGSLADATRREADVLGASGQEAFDACDYEEAVKRWEEAIRLGGDNPELCARVRKASERAQEISRLLTESRSAQSLDPAKALSRCTAALELNPRHGGALELKKQIEETISRKNALGDQAERHFRQKHFVEAIQCWEQILQMSPSESPLRERIAEARARLAQKEQATRIRLAQKEKALEALPSQASKMLAAAAALGVEWAVLSNFFTLNMAIAAKMDAVPNGTIDAIFAALGLAALGLGWALTGWFLPAVVTFLVVAAVSPSILRPIVKNAAFLFLPFMIAALAGVVVMSMTLHGFLSGLAPVSKNRPTSKVEAPAQSANVNSSQKLASPSPAPAVKSSVSTSAKGKALPSPDISEGDLAGEWRGKMVKSGREMPFWLKISDDLTAFGKAETWTYTERFRGHLQGKSLEFLSQSVEPPPPQGKRYPFDTLTMTLSDDRRSLSGNWKNTDGASGAISLERRRASP